MKNITKVIPKIFKYKPSIISPPIFVNLGLSPTVAVKVKVIASLISLVF